MRKKNYKGRCEKRTISKCEEICRTYDDIQRAYVDVLENRDDIVEIHCNIPLDHLDLGDYTSDFLCVKGNGDRMVRECVYRRLLSRPMTAKMLEASREYWSRHGVTDWGIVIDEQEQPVEAE